MENKNSFLISDIIHENDIICGTKTHDVISENRVAHSLNIPDKRLPEILFITSYPPRECGIATYSNDLIQAIDDKFGQTFSIQVCALESNDEKYFYQNKVSYVLDTSNSSDYPFLADKINHNTGIKTVIIQHEFGFFSSSGGNDFLQFIRQLVKPVILVFHTILPRPDEQLKNMVRSMAASCHTVVVMTATSKGVLEHDYGILPEKIEVIAHGTHLVSNSNKSFLKKKYGLKGHKILSTFGLLSSGKSIETTLDALPAIVERHPDTIFLAIGKTHPGVIKSEGEKYRHMLEEKVTSLHMEKHVKFINQYLSLPVLLEYLRLTDIYLFTSKDPNQAVSGTFSYAMSCGCPIVSTPIPQARETLDEHTGIVIDFRNSRQLTEGVIRLLNNEPLRKIISNNTLHKIAPTAWENSAVAHALLLKKTAGIDTPLRYSHPPINLNHIKQLTTDFGMIQFSKINRPDIYSGYTLDDNARALIALCMHFQLTKDKTNLSLMNTYLSFIRRCMQPDGRFLNYIDKEGKFTGQNNEVNLDDANGRAIWALGYLLSVNDIIPKEMTAIAMELIKRSSFHAVNIFSPRAMAFSIKGLHYFYSHYHIPETADIIGILADRLASIYDHESEKNWNWFECYLTYANSIMPEAMLLAWLSLKKTVYKDIAEKSFGFLLSQTFDEQVIKLISNTGWLQKGNERNCFGEQPIDVSYTILALQSFYNVFHNNDYLRKMEIAFSWFLGNNHLHSIIYNPCTGGCYDGLEEYQVNLNQGAESSVSYLIARIALENMGIKNKAG